MRTDTEVEADVREELSWSPDIDETDIAVKVNSGIVTLTGFVRSYGEKYQAEQATKRVAGVLGVANDIDVRQSSGSPMPDPEIARSVVLALKQDLGEVAESIQVLVHRANVTLEGKVEWNYLKERAGNSVRRCAGVVGFSNLIEIRPKVVPKDIKNKIEEAFRRNAEVDAHNVSVEARDGEVILRGRVRSIAERDEAQYTAWSAPGVKHVRNEITIGL